MVSESRWYITYTYVLAGLILTIYAMIVAKAVLVPLLFALFFSILLSPVCNQLEFYRLPRFLAALTVIIIAVLFVAAIGFLFYRQLLAFAGDAEMFTVKLEELLASMDGFLATWFSIEGDINLDRVFNAILDFVRENTATLTVRITGAASVLTATFLVPVFMFLILLFRDMLKNFLLKAFAGNDNLQKQKVESVIENVKTLVQKYISGVLMVIAILAVLNSTMLLIIGVEHAIFFGVFAAMLNVIPFIGPIFGSILPVLYSLITMDSLIYPLIIILGFYVIQLFESNLFTPVIVGSQVSMNALATLLLIFLGAQIWGLAGMILFIPLGAIIKVICDEVDSLKPYGYVMGRVSDDKSEQKSVLAKKVSQLSKKTKKTNNENNRLTV